MAEHIRVTVGVHHADLVGSTSRALQAAVDYAAALGGGTVEIGPGEYGMEDALHLRSHVTIRGHGADTVLRKCDGSVSRLILDGDYGEEQITVADPSLFKVGMGVAVTDDSAGGFHTAVRTIIAAEENTFRLNGPLLADCMVARNAIAKTVFPVISGYYVEDTRVENLTVDGRKTHNPHLNGCRGAGIFLYRAHGTHIMNCIARNYHGDGISFQQSNDVIVEHCTSHGNTHLGLHPGSGSQRPTIRHCRTFENGQIGLFLCWRVRHGLFEHNEILRNGEIGISIGHKDSDNVFRHNIVTGNRRYGIYFRDETEPMAGHRNRFEDHRIQDNGNEKEGYGIYIDGETHDITLIDSIIGDTRPEGQKCQRVGVYIGPKADRITLEGCDLDGNAEHPVQDARVRERKNDNT